MIKRSLLEKIVHKIDENMIPILAPIRRKRINNTNFTIISNNCWGGKCYEYFKLQKQSPTIGAYFFAEDYIKFVYNLKYYLSLDIEIISAKESVHYNDLKKKNQLDVPVGKLDDVEIIFLHYKDPKIAKEKWNRRVSRINWNNIILKFSYMNNCTDQLLKQFDNIKGVKKIMFIGENNIQYPNSITVLTDEHGQVKDDTYWFKKNLNIYKLINEKTTSINDLKIYNYVDTDNEK